MDCPWCGYGWFFLCPKCRKAFTFAKAVEVDLTWEELAHKDLDGKWGRQPTAEEIREWIGFMKILLKGLQLGKQHVYIDGWVFPTDLRDITFEEWHSSHQLESPPQVSNRQSGPDLDVTLGSKEYWQSRRVNTE